MSIRGARRAALEPGESVRTEQLAKLLGRPVEVAAVPFTARYPERALKWEMAKGGIGVAACVGVVFVLQPATWLAVPLLVIAALFGTYVTQQLGRLPLRFAVDDVGVTRIKGGQRTPFRWNELEEFRLNYYPNGRKAAMGMLVVVLRNGRGRLKVDSTLDQFPALLARAAEAARERRLELHPTTQANLAQLEL